MIRCRGPISRANRVVSAQPTVIFEERFITTDADIHKRALASTNIATMRKIVAPVAALLTTAMLGITGCSGASTEAEEEPQSVEVEAPNETEVPEATFTDGVLKTPEVEITITDHRVIPVGEEGNEYGSAPVLAFWYDVTNLGTADRDITPSEFIVIFEAYQDTDPNLENSLNVGALPDDAFLETQTQNIKAGGTASNAVAYELDDTTTPVELVAGRIDEIGRMKLDLV